MKKGTLLNRSTLPVPLPQWARRRGKPTLHPTVRHRKLTNGSSRLTDGCIGARIWPDTAAGASHGNAMLSRNALYLGTAILGLCLPLFAQETSVNPGINKAYLKDGLIVADWVERLEQEGREVADNREEIIARALGEHGKVYAVDIVQKFLDHVDRQIARHNWTNVEPVLCSERSIGLPTGTIDVAFICDVYHHFEYPADSLASIHRALRPGGRIVLVDFKRIPGESDDWILKHMRAGQEVFEAEIESAGFKKTAEIDDLLTSNYFVIFDKVES